MSKGHDTNLTRLVFAQTEPLTTRLHGLIRSYPRGVGLIQEFVQNADDAGATIVSVWLDERSFHTGSLPTDSMSRLQGPALVITNDATFSDDDWKRLQTIGQSDKSLDSSKTGRFGLGFNSVYNVTDFPCILSRGQLGVFDPHGTTVAGASTQTPGGAWRLDEAIWTNAPDILAPFEDYGLEARATTYSGTAFRLPLRTIEQAEVSDICKDPFTRADFESIVTKLGERVGELLLFLNSVLCIEFGIVNAAGDRRRVLAASTRNKDSVRASRSTIHDVLQQEHVELLAGLRSNGVGMHCTFSHELDLSVDGHDETSETWAITRGVFVDPEGEVLDRAEEMFSLGEKAVPSAGAASLVKSDSARESKGRVYCGLPLPLTSPAPACHLDGFFDLQASRQGLFEDPEAEGGGAVRVQWNEALIKHACAKALALHCAHLSRDALRHERSPYRAWPRVLTETRDSLDHLPGHTYSHLSMLDCISTGSEHRWLLPKDVVVVPDGATEDLHVPLLADDFPIPQPRLPRHVIAGFRACKHPLPVLSAERLRDELRVDSDCSFEFDRAPRPCLLTRSGVMALLTHCASDQEFDDLAGVPLAILASGQVCTFSSTRAQKVFLAGTEERTLFNRHSHWFIDEEIQRHCQLLVSDKAGIAEFTPQLVLVNLHKALPPIGDEASVDPSQIENAPSDEWLVKAFRYLADKHDDISLKRALIEKIPLVPDQFGLLHAMGHESTPLLASSDDQARLGKALGYFRVPIVAGGKEVLSAIRTFVETYPDDAIWRVEPRDLIDTMAAVDGPQNAADGTARYRRELHGVVLDYFASRGILSLKGEASDRVAKLRALRLFPSISGELVRLTEGDYYVPDSYELPGIETDIGLLECGPKGRWEALYRVLGVPTLTRARLLNELLLPQLPKLSPDEVLQLARWLRHHLHTIREEEESNIAEDLVSRLGSELPIECADGVSRSADALYRPDAKFVVDLLGASVGFPDLTIYSDRPELWLEFFDTLGMATTPRADDIVSAIDQLLESDTDFADKAKRVDEIAHYLEQHWPHLQDELVGDDAMRPDDSEEWHLSDALSKRAWLPVIKTAPRDFPAFMLAESNDEFYKPTNLLARSSLDLASSVHPVCAIGGMPRMAASIGLRSEPERGDVVDQLVTLSRLVVVGDDGAVPKRIGSIFRSVYAFFGRFGPGPTADETEENEDVEDIRSRVRDCDCMLDESLKLWRPDQCFEEPVPFLLGRGVRVRAEDPMLDRGLRVLGRRQTPEAADFRSVFSALAAESGDIAISADDIVLLRLAYRTAAGVCEPSELFDTPVLCENGELVSPCEVVLDDSPWLSDRIRAAGVDTLDSELDRRVAVAFGVRSLSSAVYESPQRMTASDNASFLDQCQDMAARLQSPELLRGIERLLVAADSVVRHGQLSRFFEGMAVKGVKELETILVWLDSDEPVEGSEGHSDLLFDADKNELVASEEAEDLFAEHVAIVVERGLHWDGHSLGELSANFVAMLRVAPERIDRTLTKLHVPALPDEKAEEANIEIDENEGLIDVEGVDGTSPDDAFEITDVDEPEVSEDSAPSDSELQDAAGPSEPVRPASGVIESRQTDAEEEEADEETPAATGEHLEDAQVGTERDDEFGGGTHREATDESHDTHTSSESRDNGARSRGGTRSRESKDSTGRPRSSTSSGRGWTAVTRVTAEGDRHTEESPARQEQRRRVDQAAIERVIAFEHERGRHPNVMDHANEGYDIESVGVGGEVERFIEVKGRSGPWTGFNVSYSRAQHRKAMHEKSGFWLYVVEFALEEDRSRVFAIQDPAELIDQYWFDDGWKQLSKEQDGPGTGLRPREGVKVIVDGNRQGVVKSIRSHGALKHLEIEFEGGEVESLVYTPRRVNVLAEDEGHT